VFSIGAPLGAEANSKPKEANSEGVTAAEEFD
jgi:hypothetical protein